MAHVKRVTVTTWIDPATGKRVPAGTPGATRRKAKTRRYYACYRDPRTGRWHRVRGHKDKAATAELARSLERGAERQAVGLPDPGAAARPLSELIDLYGVKLRRREGRDNHPQYVTETLGRLRRLAAGCGFATVGDIDGDKAAAWLAAEQRSARPALPDGVESFTRAEAASLLAMTPLAFSQAVYRKGLPATGQGRARRFPRRTVEAVAAAAHKAMSPRTAAAYVGHLRSFWRWLRRKHGAAGDPLDGLAVAVGDGDHRHLRRALTPEEIARVVEAARASPKVYRGLAGPDRAALYLTAVWTGLRARALGGLTPGMFEFADTVGAVRVPARLMKGKRNHTLRLAADAAGFLRDYLADRPADKPVWPGTWATGRRAAEVFRRDLRAAGVPYVVEGPHGPAVADFHALRHTVITEVSRGDASTAQMFAAHSSLRVTERYIHRGAEDLSAAAERAARLTDGAFAQKLAHGLAHGPCAPVPGGASPEQPGGVPAGPDPVLNFGIGKGLCAPVHPGAGTCERVDDGIRTRDVQIHSLVL